MVAELFDEAHPLSLQDSSAQCLADSMKAKHGVVVYTWSEDGTPPTICSFSSSCVLVQFSSLD